MSEEVGSKGILGLLTSSPDNANASDILANSDQGNLNKVLNNVSGIQKNGNTRGLSSAPGQNKAIKGDRKEGQSDLGNMMDHRQKATSENLQRQSNYAEQKFSKIDEQEAAVSGKRNPDDITVIVNRHKASVQTCYQRELKRNPDLKGKLVVRFTISPQGKVTNVQLLSSTLNNSRVERVHCQPNTAMG